MLKTPPTGFLAHRTRTPRRRGAALVEVAFVGPVTLLLVIGIMVAGIGVFRFQQVSTMAREGARWASVHGPKYEKQTNSPPITADDVYEKAVRPLMGGSKNDDMKVQLDWGTDRRTVAVTVHYAWTPQAFLKPLDLTSRAESPVAR